MYCMISSRVKIPTKIYFALETKFKKWKCTYFVTKYEKSYVKYIEVVWNLKF